MGQKTWGSFPNYAFISCTDTEEIKPEEAVYVVSNQLHDQDIVPKDTWRTLLNGDLNEIKTQIEKEIPACQVIGIRISWTSAEYRSGPVDSQEPLGYYIVKGFKVEAVVKNIGGGLTGLEIVVIIFAVSFLAVVVAIVVMVGWLVFKTVGSATEMGPPVVIGVGLFLIILFVVVLLLLFGVKIEKRPTGLKVGK